MIYRLSIIGGEVVESYNSSEDCSKDWKLCDGLHEDHRWDCKCKDGTCKMICKILNSFIFKFLIKSDFPLNEGWSKTCLSFLWLQVIYIHTLVIYCQIFWAILNRHCFGFMIQPSVLKNPVKPKFLGIWFRRHIEFIGFMFWSYFCVKTIEIDFLQFYIITNWVLIKN